MKQLFRRLVCKIRGHVPHQTDVYHIRYDDGKYDAAHDGYVVFCARCQNRLGVIK